ncbi:histone-lysine N-methyltransferase SETMAR [Trichonephila clavipes]|nr:histone-lysine N-methyltransferase SETMAR [Trichonephila clavipes]
MAKINNLKFELLLHAPYLRDLAPLDYSLFPNLKKWLSGQRFSDDEVMSAVKGYFEEQVGSYYKKGIELIEHRWEKSIELKGDYVEKYIFSKLFVFFFVVVGLGTSGTTLDSYAAF